MWMDGKKTIIVVAVIKSHNLSPTIAGYDDPECVRCVSVLFIHPGYNRPALLVVLKCTTIAV